jgi:3-deoxy-D-manno-octulosonic-acid transferase
LKTFGLEILSFLSRKSMKDLVFRNGRLGFYSDIPSPGKHPRIWFHAVSVGEVSGAAPTLLALKRKLPQAVIFLTAGTSNGIRYAAAQLPPDVAVLPFPLDFPKCVSRALHSLSPDLFIAFETEFWPNFYRQLRTHGVPALLLNGRISESSERFYRMLFPLFRPVFEQFGQMAMHSEEDRDRAARIGVPSDKMFVLGSSKYDGLLRKASPKTEQYWKEILNVGRQTPVIVGGSLRGFECTRLMEIFRELKASSPNLLGIFVPRHMHNVPKMCEWLSSKRIPYDLLTQIETGSHPRTASVVLVDRIGALFEIYSAGDLIFCGGTLEPVGGHNILEPAAWSKAVFYGPNLKKVLREHRILHYFEGSFPVLDADDLLLQWKKWIDNLDGLREHGKKAGSALAGLGGVVDRQVDLIVESLEKNSWVERNATT